MKTYSHLFNEIISFDNLQDAYQKARSRKTNTPAVNEFDKQWLLHLAILHRELRERTYLPQPLKKFILRDPKTRTICVSAFRDRIVHHALINILQPIFEPRFIHDSYASRKGKGTLAALKRFGYFLRKVTDNGKQVSGSTNGNAVCAFAFKADIKHYFDAVDHEVLLRIIAKRVTDGGVLWLTRTILGNYTAGALGKGMPLGNWTSQFFANVYLNELDQFVKHQLKAKYYIRYVDDFIILDGSKTTLLHHTVSIGTFLQTLKLDLHPSKCKTIPLCRGVSLLGFRVFYQHRLVRQRNLRKARSKLEDFLMLYEMHAADAVDVLESLNGWNAYAMHGNTYHLRQRLTMTVEQELIRRTPIRNAASAMST